LEVKEVAPVPPLGTVKAEDKVKPAKVGLDAVVKCCPVLKANWVSPILSAVTAISSALTVIVEEEPMFRVKAPTVPPPVRPEPAVTPVVAKVATLAESTKVPLRPFNRENSVESMVTPPTVTSLEPRAKAVPMLEADASKAVVMVPVLPKSKPAVTAAEVSKLSKVMKESVTWFAAVLAF
jgi:hypothetical protein